MCRTGTGELQCYAHTGKSRKRELMAAPFRPPATHGSTLDLALGPGLRSLSTKNRRKPPGLWHRGHTPLVTTPLRQSPAQAITEHSAEQNTPSSLRRSHLPRLCSKCMDCKELFDSIQGSLGQPAETVTACFGAPEQKAQHFTGHSLCTVRLLR